jgi:hypothetical protein
MICGPAISLLLMMRMLMMRMLMMRMLMMRMLMMRMLMMPALLLRPHTSFCQLHLESLRGLRHWF